MRISDWSSDVCSSDLAVRSRIYRGMVAAHRRPDHLPDLFGAAAQKRLLSRRSAAGCDVANRRDEARGNILLHDMPAAQRPKIGRAQSRERVCKYELIPVVTA